MPNSEANVYKIIRLINTIRIEKGMFWNIRIYMKMYVCIYMYIHIYACNNNKKELMHFKESYKDLWEGLPRMGKGKGKMR